MSHYGSALLFMALFMMQACGREPDINQSGNALVDADTLYIDHVFETVISTESALLGVPYQLTLLPDSRIAVYDGGKGSVLVFDGDGNRLFEFGSPGEGPGEWDPWSVSNLDFRDGLFILTDERNFWLNLFDEEGGFLRTIPVPEFLARTENQLISGGRLLAGSNGHENSLGFLLDLENDGEIVQTIGSPVVPVTESGLRVENIEEIRVALADGRVPDDLINDALVAHSENGYFFLLNTLGEIRHYDHANRLQWQHDLPYDVTGPVMDLVQRENEETSPYTVFQLQYAFDFQVSESHIYVLTSQYEGLQSHLLIYNTDGELEQRFVLIGKDTQLWKFQLDADNRMYVIDVMNSRLLRTDLSEW